MTSNYMKLLCRLALDLAMVDALHTSSLMTTTDCNERTAQRVIAILRSRKIIKAVDESGKGKPGRPVVKYGLN